MCFHTYLWVWGWKEWHYLIHVYVLRELGLLFGFWILNLPVSQVLDQDPQKVYRYTPMFVKDSKCFSKYLQSVHIGKDEELVSFDVSALFTSIPVPKALDVINQLFIEHIEIPEARGKYGCSFEQNTVGLTKDEIMKLLKLVLENCVFSFQGNFFKQLHGAAMGSPCSPVVANIYMECFEDMALGPELLLPIKEW